MYYFPIFSFIIYLFVCSCTKKIQENNNIFHYNETSSITSLDPIFCNTQKSNYFFWRCELSQFLMTFLASQVSFCLRAFLCLRSIFKTNHEIVTCQIIDNKNPNCRAKTQESPKLCLNFKQKCESFSATNEIFIFGFK